MKKLKFCIVSIKNNLRYMPGIFILLSFTVAFAFVFSGLLMRVVYTYIVEGGKNIADWDVFPFLISNVAVVGVALINMLYIYSHYLKKEEIRLTTYRMLGAKKRHLIMEIALENFLILGAGLIMGAMFDSIIHSLLKMAERHFYLNGWLFGYISLWTFTVPVLTLILVGLFQLKEPAPKRKRVREDEQ